MSLPVSLPPPHSIASWATGYSRPKPVVETDSHSVGRVLGTASPCVLSRQVAFFFFCFLLLSYCERVYVSWTEMCNARRLHCSCCGFATLPSPSPPVPACHRFSWDALDPSFLLFFRLPFSISAAT